jgi:hypothetical protein
MRCEDFPCCGHELGCCPDYDEAGMQTNMICVCGAKLPITRSFSICDSCMKDPDDPNQFDDYEMDEEEDD